MSSVSNCESHWSPGINSLIMKVANLYVLLSFPPDLMFLAKSKRIGKFELLFTFLQNTVFKTEKNLVG